MVRGRQGVPQHSLYQESCDTDNSTSYKPLRT